MTIVSRRRVLSIVASCAAFSRGATAGAPHRWRGVVMGGLASLELHHADSAMAALAARDAIAEARRLERIFSLYDPDSHLSRLNAKGFLLAPPHELLDILDRSAWARAQTAGAFDPTVQPLWDMYARHFKRPDADPAGPAQSERERALALVGLDRVAWSKDRILLQPGMKLTFNGIAQGFLSDRVAELLKARGFASCLVDMGEPRAVAPKPDGSAWRIGVGEGSRFRVLEVKSGAVATTRASAYIFGAGVATHLFDPATGRSPEGPRGISIAARDATSADALSTGLAIHRPQRIADLIADIDGANIVDLEA